MQWPADWCGVMRTCSHSVPLGSGCPNDTDQPSLHAMQPTEEAPSKGHPYEPRVTYRNLQVHISSTHASYTDCMPALAESEIEGAQPLPHHTSLIVCVIETHFHILPA